MRDNSKIAVYLRVSTPGQAKKYGLDRQLSICKKYLESQNITEYKIYRDVISSEIDLIDRPGGFTLMSDINKNLIDTIVISEFDRLSRSINIHNALDERGIKLINVSVENENSAFNKLIQNLQKYLTLDDAIKTSLAYYSTEVKIITERAGGGRNERGKIDGERGGGLPYGYQRKFNEIEINIDESRLIKRIFELRNKGYSLRNITFILNYEGYKTRIGGKFIFTQIQRILQYKKIYQGKHIRGNNENNICYPKIID